MIIKDTDIDFKDLKKELRKIDNVSVEAGYKENKSQRRDTRVITPM